MKYLTPVVLLLATGPALAHTGAHIHPHVGDPVWLPVVVGLMVIGAAARLACLRKAVWAKK